MAQNKNEDSYRDTSVEMKAVDEFDAEKYMGSWYEVARYPNVHARDCTATTVHYELLDNGNVSVLNQCHVGNPQGPVTKAQGEATIMGPGKLNVKFSQHDDEEEPDYWVLGVRGDYQMAVVGNPYGTSGWVLSRSLETSDDDWEWARSVLKKNGYDLSELKDTPH